MTMAIWVAIAAAAFRLIECIVKVLPQAQQDKVNPILTAIGEFFKLG